MNLPTRIILLIAWPLFANQSAYSQEIDSAFYNDVQYGFLKLFQSFKNKDSKMFIDKYRHLFGSPDTMYKDLLTNQFKIESLNCNKQELDNAIKRDYDRLFSFGTKHNLNWTNVKTTEIKFSVNNSDVIIIFKHSNDFYLMRSGFSYSSSNNKNKVSFPTSFETIKAYHYNKNIKGFFDEFDKKAIGQEEYRNKLVEYAESQYKHLSKTDIQYINQFDKIEGIYEIRAKSRYITGNYFNAIQDFNKVIELATGKQVAEAYYYRGRCKQFLKDYTSAILDFDKYIILDSKLTHNTVYLFRADAKYSQKNYRGALTDYNKAIHLDPKDFRGYYSRGLIKYFELASKKDGCLDWSKAGELGFEKAYELINEKCH